MERTDRLSLISPDDLWRCCLHNLQDGILVSDLEGIILDCNQAVCRLTERPDNELIGQLLDTAVDIESWERSVKDKDKEIVLAHPITSNTTHGGNDGDRRSINKLPCSPIAHATILCRTGNLVMPVSHIPVTDLVGTVIGFITIIYITQTSSAKQAQSDFVSAVSTVSHELRTPLTSIKGFADTILRAGGRIEAGQQRRYLGIIKDQADRLTRLVEDLLAVSRLESKKMQLTVRAIDFSETLQRVLRNLSEKANNHHIVTNIAHGLPPVWADADRLEQILTNLIDNALKYSPGQTTVTIAARELDSVSEMVEFSVSNEGPGIPSELLPQIFNKFSRLDNPLVRQTEGTGLGLYITRSLVLALGGQIQIESAPGKTTFTVKLKTASLEEQAARGRD